MTEPDHRRQPQPHIVIRYHGFFIVGRSWRPIVVMTPSLPIPIAAAGPTPPVYVIFFTLLLKPALETQALPALVWLSLEDRPT
jgi:hypothetical protein